MHHPGSDTSPSSIYTFPKSDASSIPATPQAKLSLKTRIFKFLNKKDNRADQPPDGGVTAWLQVFACFCIFMNNFGLIYTFGVFEVYYEDVMLRSYSPAAISAIGTVQAGLTFLVGILSGPLFDKGFFFPVLVCGSIGLVCSFLALSFCTAYWQVLLCQGLLSGTCTGLLYIPSISQIPLYFSLKRGRAIGIVLSGGSFGGIVYPLIFRSMLTTVGFARATRAIAFVSMGLQIIAIILIKPISIPNRPKKLADPTMFKDFYYVAFLIAAFAGMCGTLIPFFDCGTFFLNKVDLNIDSAFHTLLYINGGNFIGRLVMPAVTDFGVAAEWMLSISSFAMAILGFAWIAIETSAPYSAFLVLYGFFSAAPMSLPPIILPYLCPRPEVFATRLGVVYAIAGIGFLISVPIANAIDGSRSSFLGAQIWTGSTCFFGAVFTVQTCIWLGGRSVVDLWPRVRRGDDQCLDQ
ncbi:MFS general substrate transporter [Myriangium duriaei CBS 260.36]|uniref:MFS general substrate transporter n=1 Tax=Myriangium duriaei CBS 260.36 TaxID=1168546 RepID=A0A9P4J304_9PEZI|nr:MFS general substrate transporter [Myriangium duriaei CBS 260.36]